MFSLCFIELQQMSNKLEKITLFKLPSILFVQCTQTRWGQCRGVRRMIANTVHIATFTSDRPLGFPCLKVRIHWGQ